MTCQFCTLPFPHRIVREYEHWTVQVADSQQLLGYLVISLKAHKQMIIDLSDEELLEFKHVCAQMQASLANVFQPDWYNYLQFGNMSRHLHIYLVPRYQHPRIFEGRQFVDERFGKQPERRWVIEDEELLEKIAAKIRGSGE